MANFVPFDERVDASGGPDACWPWTGKRQPTGYGYVMRGGRAVATHRAAYEAASGKPIPKGMWICHRCDNRPCCNPAHLFLGTAKTNTGDMIAKGRGRMFGRRVKPKTETVLNRFEYLELASTDCLSDDELEAVFGSRHAPKYDPENTNGVKDLGVWVPA